MERHTAVKCDDAISFADVINRLLKDSNSNFPFHDFTGNNLLAKGFKFM